MLTVWHLVDRRGEHRFATSMMHRLEAAMREFRRQGVPFHVIESQHSYGE